MLSKRPVNGVHSLVKADIVLNPRLYIDPENPESSKKQQLDYLPEWRIWPFLQSQT